MKRIQGLLDQGALAGSVPVRRQFGPPRRALFVDRSDIEDAQRAVDEACQVWGGAATLLLPVDRDATALTPTWRAIHDLAVIDAYVDRGLAPQLAKELEETTPTLFSEGNQATLLPVFASIKGDSQKWNPVVVPRLTPTEPWHIAYTAALGSWPDAPDTSGFEQLDLRTDVEFSDFIRCRVEDVHSANAGDLLQRIRDARSNSPVNITLVELGRRSISGTLTSGNGLLPDPFRVARAVGPSVVVLYEPGSVEDLCLLWNLRWCFGMPYGAPLGLPTTVDLEQSIREWTNNTAIFSLNLSGSYFALTSLSISEQEISSVAKSVQIGDWRAESPEKLFWPTDRAFRTSADVAMFHDGVATLPAWHASDREVFYPTRRLDIAIRPVVRYVLEGERLPSFKLEGLYSIEAANRGGGMELPARGPTDMSTLWWPSGWETLSGLLEDRGLTGEASSSGSVAAGALRHLGSVHALSPCVSPEAVSLLYYVAERRGTTRFKEQIRRLAQDVSKSVQSPQAQLDSIEQRLQELSLPASEDERRDVTFDEIYKRLGDRKAADAWTRWAESAGLILRGLPFRCDSCGRRDWKPLAEIGPPWSCRWCAASISRPFPSGQVVFGYAASATTLSLVGEDALPHLLALRWCDRIFSRPKDVHGAYPGVLLKDAQTGQDVGEADVLLVFSNGSLVPGECKLRSTGWNANESKKLDAVCEALNSPWSFIATPQASRDCTNTFERAATDGPRPRFVVTGEQLFDPHPFWALGDSPFAWREMSDEDWVKRQSSFNDTLPGLVEGLERLRSLT